MKTSQNLETTSKYFFYIKNKKLSRSLLGCIYSSIRFYPSLILVKKNDSNLAMDAHTIIGHWQKTS